MGAFRRRIGAFSREEPIPSLHRMGKRGNDSMAVPLCRSSVDVTRKVSDLDEVVELT